MINLISNDLFLSQFATKIFIIFLSVQGRWMTWQFVKENWDELHKRFEGGFLLSRLIKVSPDSSLIARSLMIFFSQIDTDKYITI